MTRSSFGRLLHGLPRSLWHEYTTYTMLRAILQLTGERKDNPLYAVHPKPRKCLCRHASLCAACLRKRRACTRDVDECQNQGLEFFAHRHCGRDPDRFDVIKTTVKRQALPASEPPYTSVEGPTRTFIVRFCPTALHGYHQITAQPIINSHPHLIPSQSVSSASHSRT